MYNLYRMGMMQIELLHFLNLPWKIGLRSLIQQNRTDLLMNDIIFREWCRTDVKNLQKFIFALDNQSNKEMGKVDLFMKN